MESSMLQYYKKELQTLGTEYKVQQDLSSTGSGIGFIAPEGQITSMVQNFYQANKDNLDTFWHQAHRSYFVSQLIEQHNPPFKSLHNQLITL